MNFELRVGWRYTRAKRGNGFVSFISLISMVGIALGVAALIVVLSVMNGFQEELRARILGATSHLQVTAPGGLSAWQEVVERVSQQPGVQGAAPYVREQGMIAFNDAMRGVTVRGVLPGRESAVANLHRRMVSGDMDALAPGEYGIVLGIELAQGLRTRVGERVTLVTPQGLVTPAGVVPRLKQFRVVGVFEVGHFEYDSGLALVHLADAQRLYRLDDRVTGVRARLDDLFEAPAVARALAPNLPALEITDWTRTHASFFRAVRIEKTVMFVILALIVAVAAFNIVSMLVMVVTDKQADIAILRTLGASPGAVMRIFVIQGSVIGLAGSALGLIAGIALSANLDTVVPFIEGLLRWRFFDPSVFYIPGLPSRLDATDIATIAVLACALSLAATLYPSWRASRVRPAEALRYE